VRAFANKQDQGVEGFLATGSTGAENRRRQQGGGAQGHGRDEQGVQGDGERAVYGERRAGA